MQLSELKGLGPTRLKTLCAMGISSLRDLLYFLPLRYEDMTGPVSCGNTAVGMTCLVQARVAREPKLSRYGKLTRVTCALEDETGKLPLIWFNQPWMMR